MRLLVRLTVAFLVLAASGLGYRCARPPASAEAPPAPSVRELPLTEDEAWAWASLQHEIRLAEQRWLADRVKARSLDPRTTFDTRRGILIAPVTSAP